mmetsp:Transcript_31030/g.80838  ORF Transcript_31030/g.80838 Transcript_31030/m.80838 type:complete len:226 (-) Transcript_31030:1982-2659(-)
MQRVSSCCCHCCSPLPCRPCCPRLSVAGSYRHHLLQLQSCCCHCRYLLRLLLHQCMLRRAWGAGWWGQLMWWGMRACLEGRPKPDEDLEGCWSGWPVLEVCSRCFCCLALLPCLAVAAAAAAFAAAAGAGFHVHAVAVCAHLLPTPESPLVASQPPAEGAAAEQPAAPHTARQRWAPSLDGPQCTAGPTHDLSLNSQGPPHHYKSSSPIWGLVGWHHCWAVPHGA